MHFLKTSSLNFNVFLFLYLTLLTRISSSDNQLNTSLKYNTHYKSWIHVHKRQKRIRLYGIYVSYGGSVNSSELWRHVLK